jgi:serine/threonine protein kinase
MEYLEYGDLSVYLSNSDAFPELDVQAIVFQILEGISFMHDNYFAHRDLKPQVCLSLDRCVYWLINLVQNILIKSCPPEPWWVKIADFGISKRVEDTFGNTSTVKGTLDFMAPELLFSQKNKALDNSAAYATDIWAIGCMAFLMLSKEMPFPTLMEIVDYARGSLEFPNTALKSHKISGAGEDFIATLLRQKPQDRPGANEALKYEWMPQPIVIANTNPPPRLQSR